MHFQIGKCVYLTKKVDFAGIRCQVSRLWSEGEEVQSGAIVTNTRVSLGRGRRCGQKGRRFHCCQHQGEFGEGQGMWSEGEEVRSGVLLGELRGRGLKGGGAVWSLLGEEQGV